MCIPQKIIDKRSARKAENRIAIMDAAEEIVLAGGLKALTADALAEKSGVSRRTIFNHFPSVEAAAVERLQEYLNRVFEIIPSLCTPGSEHPERDMLNGVRAAFTTEQLEKHVAPHSRLLFALQNFSLDNKFVNEYSSNALMSATEAVIEELWRGSKDVPRLRIAIFAHMVAGAACEGIITFYTENQDAPRTLEDSNKLREYIYQCLDYIEELLDGKYA